MHEIASKIYRTDILWYYELTCSDSALAAHGWIDVGEVFGETGSYLARQIVADGIYGYRIYGNISYFEAGNVTIGTVQYSVLSLMKKEEIRQSSTVLVGLVVLDAHRISTQLLSQQITQHLQD